MANESNGGNRGSGGGTPRWLIGVLLISLMANMVVVGTAAGRMWAHHRGHGWFDRDKREHGMRGFLHELPEARRAEVKELIRSDRAGLREEREKVRALHKAVRDAMLREPFDKAALEAALSEVNTARQSFRARVTGDLVRMLERLTPAERKIFVDKGLGRRGGKHGGRF